VIESLIAKNWRTLALVAVILFAWFVWPTPYKQLPLRNGIWPQRENRLTKKVEVWDDVWATEKGWQK